MARAPKDADVIEDPDAAAPAPEDAPPAGSAPVCEVVWSGRLWSVRVDGVQVVQASTWTKGAAYVRHHYGVTLSAPPESDPAA